MCYTVDVRLQFTPSLSREAISGKNDRKSRELRREMLRQQHFCACLSMQKSLQWRVFCIAKRCYVHDPQGSEQ